MLELAGATQLVLGGNPIQSPIAWIVGSIGSYLHSLHPGRVLEDPQGPLGLLVPLGSHPLAAAAGSPLARVTPSCGGQKTCAFQNIANSVEGIGWVLLGILLVARMLKLAATGRFRSPEHVLFDLAPKLMLGILAIQFFDRALNDLAQVSMQGAFILEDALLGPIHVSLKGTLDAFPTNGFGFVLIPILWVLVLYLLLLVVTSRLVLLLGALISPLGIPIALNDEQGGLARSWIRMIVSSLLVPVLAGIGTAGSLALAWLVHQVTGNGPFWGSYLGALTGECGLFFTAFVTTAMFKDVVRQGVAGVRGSIASTQMGAVTRAADGAVDTGRRGAQAAMGAALMAAGLEGAGLGMLAGAAKRSDGSPEPDAGDGAAAVPPLPGGPGASSADSGKVLPPAPLPRLPGRSETNDAGPEALLDGTTIRRLPAGPREPGTGSLMLPPAVHEHRRAYGGQIVLTREIELREVVLYADHLSQPAGDLIDDEPADDIVDSRPRVLQGG